MPALFRVLRKNAHLVILALALAVSLYLLQYAGKFHTSDAPAAVTESHWCETIFSRELRFGDSGLDVYELQRTLNSSPDTILTQTGAGSSGRETSFYGPRTYGAVVRFQEKHSAETLAPLGFSVGTGIIDSRTLSKITEVCMGLYMSPVEEVPENLDKGTSFSIWSILGILLVVWGLNFTFWGIIGGVRYLTDKIGAFIYSRRNGGIEAPNQIKKEDVAVMMAAHNEELVIAEALKSLLGLVKPEQIYVASDGSKDRTVEIAKKHGVSVIDINPNRGKAGALEEGIRHFKIREKYRVIVLVDADTRLKYDYLDKALPFFNDSEVIAVAGYACTLWDREKLSWKQIPILLHRDRMYFLFQMLIKFGQTWKYTNVSHIIPGFASIYRTAILDQITMNPPGLVIEDFNMTFEVHHKNLGMIAHHPSVVAYTQDPDTVMDYYKQIKRWHLGLWQTIKLHGIWPSKFWLSMIITLTEVILGSVTFLLMPFLIVAYLLFPSEALATLLPGNIEQNFFRNILIIWGLDYLLTVVVALSQRRSEYLLVGILFPLFRFVDGVAFLLAIPRAFLVRSDGRWASPSRRALT